MPFVNVKLVGRRLLFRGRKHAIGEKSLTDVIGEVRRIRKGISPKWFWVSHRGIAHQIGWHIGGTVRSQAQGQLAEEKKRNALAGRRRIFESH